MSKSSMMTLRISLMLFLLLLLANSLQACTKPPAPQPVQDYFPTQAWRSSTPEAQGVDSALLSQMLEAIQRDGLRLHSLLVVRHGYLVLEAYWDPYAPEDKHSIESNTKSIIGTLVGIAIDRGELQGVDQKLVDFFPEQPIRNLDDRKRLITLQSLLSMTPGLDCQDQTPLAQGMYQATNWAGYLLDLPMVSEPGSQWVYCSGAVHLLSAVLGRAAGMDARSYANRYLFEPLGIPAVEEVDWGADLQGVTNGIAGLYLAPRDLAKYGLLYLNKGQWDGRQVVPAAWVAESTRQQAYIGKDEYVGGLDRRFGYLWSLFPDLKYYGYLGMAGQELYVLPEQDMLVVFTGGLEVGKEARLLELVNDFIVPSARSAPALPPDPKAVSRLESLIQAAAGPSQPVPDLPQRALEVSGKTYIMDTNTLGWTDMTFTFQPGSSEAALKIADAPELKIGMDNRYRLNEVPSSRPVGLKARWLPSGELHLDFIVLGDFIQSAGQVLFEGERVTLNLTNLNFGGPLMVFQGKLKP